MKLAITYIARVSGTDVAGQAWTVETRLDGYAAGEFSRAVSDAMRAAFVELTNGRAVYGKPGVSCRGPYRITALAIEETRDPERRRRTEDRRVVRGAVTNRVNFYVGAPHDPEPFRERGGGFDRRVHTPDARRYSPGHERRGTGVDRRKGRDDAEYRARMHSLSRQGDRRRNAGDHDTGPCPMCGGDGFHPDDGPPAECPECGGDGAAI